MSHHLLDLSRTSSLCPLSPARAPVFIRTLVIAAMTGGFAVSLAGAGELPSILSPWRALPAKTAPVIRGAEGDASAAPGEADRPASLIAAPRLRETGDTVADPFSIPGLPFEVEGGTCGFANDYDYACPYEGSTAPDVVYRYNCTEGIDVDIDLCSSTYDTKVYVFEDEVGSVIACNDDYCGFQSMLTDVPFQAGHDYYIVVDGYGDSCGAYQLAVRPHSLCLVYCYQGSIHENEPPCRDNFNDNYNGGCCCTHLNWSVIPPSDDQVKVCGESGTYLYDDMQYRDSDWYEIDVQQTGLITWCCTAEFPVTIILIDGREGCGNYELMEYAVAGPCETACISRVLEPGIYWPWVGPSVFEGVPCPSTYRMTFDGYVPSAGVAEGDAPLGARLYACAPNPIGTAAEIRFELTQDASVHLGIYDLAGRCVRVLRDGGTESAGLHAVRWDRRDAAGNEVGTGIYQYRLAGAGVRAARQLLVVR